MSCFCKVELHGHFLYCSHGTRPLGSRLPNEFHFLEEQKHQTLAIVLAVISHVSLLYILDHHTCETAAKLLLSITPLLILFKRRHSEVSFFYYI